MIHHRQRLAHGLCLQGFEALVQGRIFLAFGVEPGCAFRRRLREGEGKHCFFIGGRHGSV